MQIVFCTQLLMLHSVGNKICRKPFAYITKPQELNPVTDSGPILYE